MKELKKASSDNILFGIKITLTGSYLAVCFRMTSFRLKRHSKNEFALGQTSSYSISFTRGVEIFCS